MVVSVIEEKVKKFKEERKIEKESKEKACVHQKGKITNRNLVKKLKFGT
jgi:hypothetical protein